METHLRDRIGNKGFGFRARRVSQYNIKRWYFVTAFESNFPVEDAVKREKSPILDHLRVGSSTRMAAYLF